MLKDISYFSRCRQLDVVLKAPGTAVEEWITVRTRSRAPRELRPTVLYQDLLSGSMRPTLELAGQD
jgi:hypothetical protein